MSVEAQRHRIDFLEEQLNDKVGCFPGFEMAILSRYLPFHTLSFLFFGVNQLIPLPLIFHHRQRTTGLAQNRASVRQLSELRDQLVQLASSSTALRRASADTSAALPPRTPAEGALKAFFGSGVLKGKLGDPLSFASSAASAAAAAAAAASATAAAPDGGGAESDGEAVQVGSNERIAMLESDCQRLEQVVSTLSAENRELTERNAGLDARIGEMGRVAESLAELSAEKANLATKLAAAEAAADLVSLCPRHETHRVSKFPSPSVPDVLLNSVIPSRPPPLSVCLPIGGVAKGCRGGGGAARVCHRAWRPGGAGGGPGTHP